MAGVEVQGITPLLREFVRIERVAGKRAMRAMDKYAEKIAKLASEYAPKKDGYLEDSIWVDKDVQQARDALGRFAQKRILIGVHYEALGPGFQKSGFDYATHIHEAGTSPKFEKVGKRSRAKAASRGLGAWARGERSMDGRYVGPWFLDRAAIQIEPELVARIEQIMSETIR